LRWLSRAPRLAHPLRPLAEQARIPRGDARAAAADTDDEDDEELEIVDLDEDEEEGEVEAAPQQRQSAFSRSAFGGSQAQAAEAAVEEEEAAPIGGKPSGEQPDAEDSAALSVLESALAQMFVLVDSDDDLRLSPKELVDGIVAAGQLLLSTHGCRLPAGTALTMRDLSTGVNRILSVCDTVRALAPAAAPASTVSPAVRALLPHPASAPTPCVGSSLRARSGEGPSSRTGLAAHPQLRTLHCHCNCHPPLPPNLALTRTAS
jgi:hypothetical protein